MKKHNYCILLCLLFLMNSCLDDSNKTIILPSGSISNDVIPDEIRSMLEEYIPIYEGFKSPYISGFYFADEVTARYCSDGYYAPGKIIADHYMYFGPQNASGIIYKYEGRQNKLIESSKLVQVVGNNNNFTAFYVSEGLIDWDNDGVYETWSKESTLISGTVTNKGIEDWAMAIIMVDKNDPLQKLMDINVYRVFYEGDYLVDRISDWRNKVPDRKKTSTKDCDSCTMVYVRNINTEND